MKKLAFLFVAAAVLSFASCGEKTGKDTAEVKDTVSVTVADTTVYGICSDGTTMNCLELATADNDTLRYIIQGDSIFSPVKGGMMCGDRMAVIGHKSGDDLIADNIINLTTLLGRWSSIDKNFEIQEGGLVKSTVTETNKYISWEIFNGRLILAPDTFSVYELGPDSLMLENNEGIFAFTRLKN